MVRRLTAWLPLLPAAALVGAGIALSQPAGTDDDPRQALIDARNASAAATARSKQLQQQAVEERDEAARTRAEAAALAARVQAAEADVGAAEARIALVADLQARQRAGLAARQGPILRLTAALQTMARRPPALVLAQPGSISDLVHVRALLGTTLPAVRQRTAGLRSEIVEGRRLRASAEQAAAGLRAGQARLVEAQQALGRIEAAHRARARDLAGGALIESDRAIALGEKARDIVDLIRRLDADAAVGRDLAALPGPLPRPGQQAMAMAPQVAAAAPAAAPLAYRLPITGRLVTGFGEISAAGVRGRGLTLATRSGAQVVAPGAGRILYAAAYRGFGHIVIIDHGRGWISLVTGLAGVTVAVGDQLDQGGPIGRAGTAITVELRHDGQPVDIVPLVSAG